MDYEKKYNELIDAIKVMMEANPHDEGLQNWVQDNVPELTESEDEKVRKEIKRAIDVALDYSYFDKETANNCLAWLEKQDESKVSEPNWCHHKVDLSDCSEEYRKAYYDGWNNCNMQHSQCNEERNDVVKCLINGMKFYYEDNEYATWGTDKWSMPVKHIIEVLEKQGDKSQGKTAIEAIKEEKVDNRNCATVEPKFDVGEWIVWQDKCYRVNYNGCGYELVDQNGLTTSCEYGTIDENAHLWTIEDAKDGDVLIVFGLPFIYCCFDDYQGNYCCIYFDGVFRTSFDFGFNGKTILPATKEQRDILFSKMKEAGYMWDAEKKELFTTCLKMVLNEIWKRRRKNNR